MSVASHLQIRLDEYDTRIQTFIPGYDAMLSAAAGALRALDVREAHIVDLGTGTGALAARCLKVLPDARLTAIDADPDILAHAQHRLGGRAASAAFVHGAFESVTLSACDAIVASLSLHHIRTTDAKRQVYRRCRAALAAGGLLVSADCCPPADIRLASLARQAWRDHLCRTYTGDEADRFFAAWADEDVYFTIEEECSILGDAGFVPDVIWRDGIMAVIAARAGTSGARPDRHNT